MEENKNKTNVDIKTILIRAALIVGILFSSFVSVFESFNLIVGVEYAVEIESLYSTIRWLMPIIITLIYYGLYRVYINLMRSTLNSRMGMFSRIIDIKSLRNIVDPFIAILAIYVGLVNIFFMFFPVYKNVWLSIAKLVGTGICCFCIHRRLIKNLEKIFSPIIYWGLQLPFVLLVVLV